jgi:hypothetical protein
VEEAGAAAAARSSDTIVAAALDDAMVAIAGTVAVADGVGVRGGRTPGLGGLVGVDGRKERGRNRRRESGRGGGK